MTGHLWLAHRAVSVRRDDEGRLPDAVLAGRHPAILQGPPARPVPGAQTARRDRFLGVIESRVWLAQDVRQPHPLRGKSHCVAITAGDLCRRSQ